MRQSIVLVSLWEWFMLRWTLEIAVQRLTQVVCVDHSSWYGRNVQFKVQKRFSWTRASRGNLRRSARETLLSSIISFVSSVLCVSTLSCHILVFEMIYFLEKYGSDHCQREAGFFICQSSFPLCNCKSGQTYLASREDCERISIIECEEEWTSAKEYGIPLPNCTGLPEGMKSKNGN